MKTANEKREAYFTSEEALEIVTEHGRNPLIADGFHIEDIRREFSWLTDRELGGRAVYLANPSTNNAGTFKIYGALVGTAAYKERDYDRIVVPSAGNHARGAVLAAKVLGIGIDVIIPNTAPPAKKEGLHTLAGADMDIRVFEAGPTFDDAYQKAREIESRSGGALLHPYDDPDVARGQGVIVDKLVERHEKIDHIVLPIGGGGLYAGINNRVRELGLAAHVHGVEAPGSDSLSRSTQKQTHSAATAPNDRFKGSAVMYTGQEALRAHDANQEHTTIHTDIDMDTIETFIAEYENNLRERECKDGYLEPTSLVAAAALEKIIKNTGTNDTFFYIATGYNAPLYEAQGQYRRRSNMLSSYVPK